MERLEGLYEEEKWTPFGETNTESGEASAALKEPALGTNYATSESECTPTTGPKRTQKPDTKAKQAKASEKPSGVAQVPAKKKSNKYQENKTRWYCPLLFCVITLTLIKIYRYRSICGCTRNYSPGFSKYSGR